MESTQGAVRWDDNIPFPNRSPLRILEAGQVPVPTGCHPQSLQGSVAWRFLPVLVKRFTPCSVLSPCLGSLRFCWLPLGSLYVYPFEIFQSMGIYLPSWTVPWLGQPGGQNPFRETLLQSRNSLSATCLAYMNRTGNTLLREASSLGWLTA